LPSRNWKPKPFCFEDLILFEVPGVGVQFAGPGHLHSQRLVAFDPMPDVVPLKSKEPGTQGDAPRAVVHGWVAQLGREHVGVFRLGHPRVQQGILRRPVATKCTHQREILFLDPNFACCKSYKTGDKTLVITGSPFFTPIAEPHCWAYLVAFNRPVKVLASARTLQFQGAVTAQKNNPSPIGSIGTGRGRGWIVWFHAILQPTQNQSKPNQGH
jgi:hypothetical protein